MDPLHATWHTITTRPGITLAELGNTPPTRRALRVLLGAGYVERAGDSFWPVVPFVAVRRGWVVAR